MLSKFHLSLLLLGVCATAGVGTGCFRLTPVPSALPYAAQFANGSGDAGRPPLPNPTKDEVALVDGRALTLTDFFALREHLRNRSTEAVLWAGTAALALQNESRARGGEIPSATAVEIALYALGEQSAAEADTSLRKYFAPTGLPPKPTEVRVELDRLLALAAVRRNERALSSLSQL